MVVDRRHTETLSSVHTMSRSYVPHEQKHKWPQGFGALCPRMPTTASGELLAKAISVPGCGTNKLWVAQGRWCFCAHPSPHAGAEAWHGFPVIGGTVDERVLQALCEAGHISKPEVRQLRKQKELPKEWP